MAGDMSSKTPALRHEGPESPSDRFPGHQRIGVRVTGGGVTRRPGDAASGGLAVGVTGDLGIPQGDSRVRLIGEGVKLSPGDAAQGGLLCPCQPPPPIPHASSSPIPVFHVSFFMLPQLAKAPAMRHSAALLPWPKAFSPGELPRKDRVATTTSGRYHFNTTPG